MTDQEQKIILSRNLNRLLSDNGKSQKEVAAALGVLPTTFNNWCKGIALPRIGKIQALADYFGVKKSALIDEPPASAARPVDPDADFFYKYRQLDAEDKRAVEVTVDTLLRGSKYQRGLNGEAAI